MILEKTTMLDREKAAKIAMLLTSDQPGEVVAAAGRLVAMLKAVDMTPADLLTPADCSSLNTNGMADDLALRRAHAEAEHFKKEVQRQRAWYEEMLQQRDDALARVDELEDELEELLPPLDWVSLAEAFRRANRRGANSNCGKTMEYLACIGKLTLKHKRKLREFSKSRRGKKAA
jgi:hypothetical protein